MCRVMTVLNTHTKISLNLLQCLPSVPFAPNQQSLRGLPKCHLPLLHGKIHHLCIYGFEYLTVPAPSLEQL